MSERDENNGDEDLVAAYMRFFKITAEKARERIKTGITPEIFYGESPTSDPDLDAKFQAALDIMPGDIQKVLDSLNVRDIKGYARARGIGDILDSHGNIIMSWHDLARRTLIEQIPHGTR